MIGFSTQSTPLARFDYPLSSQGIISAGIQVPWPPLPFGKLNRQGQTTWGGNVTRMQCEKACSGSTSPSGVCTAINYDELSSQCYLYAHVTAHKSAGNSTWRSYEQRLQPGTASSCHDTAGLISAWESDQSMQILTQLSAKFNRKVLLSFGYQSRPDAHRAPGGALRPGATDCSVWIRCYDEACQASLADAALTAFSKAPFLSGVLWSYWSADPTQGGRSDSSRSPRGKTAEGTLRKYFGAASLAVPAVSATLPEDGTGDTGSSGAGGRGTISSNPDRRMTINAAKAGMRNGYVFGTGEWSAANVTLTEAQLSIDNAVAAGANALEFMVTYYAKHGVESTTFYPANASSPLATASDANLLALFKYAKRTHNLTVAFTPFLDPICNDPSEGCQGYWRGQLCQGVQPGPDAITVLLRRSLTSRRCCTNGRFQHQPV